MIKNHIRYLISTKNWEELKKYGSIDEYLQPDESVEFKKLSLEQIENNKLELEKELNKKIAEDKIDYEKLSFAELKKFAERLSIKPLFIKKDVLLEQIKEKLGY